MNTKEFLSEASRLSGTDRQKSDRKYYRNRICKKANS